LSELLNVPGINIVSNSQRKAIQQKLRIPLTNIPSLATSLRIARESGTTLLVTGRYNILPAQEDPSTATVNVTARIIRVNEGRFLSEELPDGRRITRDIAIYDALGNLQTVQGQIAYQILYQRDKALPYSQNQLIESANKVPPRAFEAYIKGLLTATPEIRENYFKNAMRLFAESNSEGTFAEAALELGHLYLNQRRQNEAIEAFERVMNANQQCRDRAKAENRVSQCKDESFAEASFYIGVVRWQQKNYEQALSVLRPLADDLKITSVYNMLGAIAVEASRAEKKDQARAAALLNEGLDLLKKAAEASPDDKGIGFNYALALHLHGDHIESIERFRTLVATDPRDGEAHYVLAKSLAELKDASAADIDNEARTLLAAANRYANLEREYQKSKSLDINLRVEQPQRKDFVSVILSRREVQPTTAAVSGTESLLAQARTFYKNGSDDEAMAVLRRVLVSEPMSAESYLILGKIHLRRGDRDQAISSFKTTLFWDNRQIDAHIALGKLYLEKNDCQQAKTFAISALEIDQNNPEALGLQRQVERCSK
ncbi:MAG: tetratricopeptide repeat protein, partial [Pyrinomonadaceae bacterium]|nr:tetratricopeptide repeat protein [Pyrinomonadaceae bacterium]